MDNYLSREQFEQLLKPINPSRVSKDGKGFSHIEAYDVRAHLNRIFGFARWSAETLDCDLIFEKEDFKEIIDRKTGEVTRRYPIWTVCYKAKVMLTIHARDGVELATYTEFAGGDAQNQPSRADAHDLAMKTAESQALKRCAVNVGDQFGLSLYDHGSVKGVVMTSLMEPPAETKKADSDA